MSPSAGSAVRLDAFEGGGRGVHVAGEHRGAGQAGAEESPPVAVGQLDGVPVGDRGGGVAQREQQVGPQRQGPGTQWALDVGLDPLDEFEGVAVGADGGLALGGSDQVRAGGGGVAGLDQVVADAGRGRTQGFQTGGGVAVDTAAPVGGDIGREGVTDQAVPELVVRAGVCDDAGVEGGVEVDEGVVVGQVGERDELVGVEGRAQHGHSLQDVPGLRAEGGRARPSRRTAPRTGRSRPGGPARRPRTAIRPPAPRCGPPCRRRRWAGGGGPAARPAGLRAGPSSWATAPARVVRLARNCSNASVSGVGRYPINSAMRSVVAQRAR